MGVQERRSCTSRKRPLAHDRAIRRIASGDIARIPLVCKPAEPQCLLSHKGAVVCTGIGLEVTATAEDIVHDAEYYILEAQNGKNRAAQDKTIKQKLAALEKKFGRPPNLIHVMQDDTAFGDEHFPGIQQIRGLKTPYLSQLAAEGILFTRMYTEVGGTRRDVQYWDAVPPVPMTTIGHRQAHWRRTWAWILVSTVKAAVAASVSTCENKSFGRCYWPPSSLHNPATGLLARDFQTIDAFWPIQIGATTPDHAVALPMNSSFEKLHSSLPGTCYK